MKQGIFVLFFLAFTTLGAHEYHLLPTKVAKDVYCFFGALENITKENGGNMVNTCYVKTKEGFVVIDSGPTYGYAKAAYSQMQTIAKLPVKYVIATHDHDDHWLGNSFYKEQGALLMGPRTYEQNVATGMETRMHRILGDDLYAKTKIVRLDSVVENNASITLGEKKFEISQWVPKAHTKGDLLVYLPEQKVLFTGDTVFTGRLTSLRDGSLIGSLKLLEKIEALNPKVIISGHGYERDIHAVTSFKAYLLEMKKQILEAMENDVGMGEITKVVRMPAYQQMQLYDVLHKRNVLDAYSELEMFDTEEEE